MPWARQLLVSGCWRLEAQPVAQFESLSEGEPLPLGVDFKPSLLRAFFQGILKPEPPTPSCWFGKHQGFPEPEGKNSLLLAL